MDEDHESRLISLAGEIVGLPQKGKYTEMFVRQNLVWRTNVSGGRGLHNAGRTCYLNAVIQCLAHLPPLAQYFLALDLSTASHYGPLVKICGNTIKQVLRRDGGAVHPKANAFKPVMLINNLKLVGEQFRWNAEADAHEFLRLLVDGMKSCSLANVKKTDHTRLKTTTAMDKIFGGYVRNQLKCTQCGNTSTGYEQFLDLLLEIPNGVRSVEGALEAFTSEELLEGSDQWFCATCNKLVDAHKDLSVFKPPNALVLSLKRFHRNGGGNIDKIEQHVQFGSSLTVKVTGPEEFANYKLTGVVEHIQTGKRSGHYRAYVKTPEKRWCRVDDSRVFEVKAKEVAASQAYVLFYTRVASRKNQRGPSPALGTSSPAAAGGPNAAAATSGPSSAASPPGAGASSPASAGTSSDAAGTSSDASPPAASGGGTSANASPPVAAAVAAAAAGTSADSSPVAVAPAAAASAAASAGPSADASPAGCGADFPLACDAPDASAGAAAGETTDPKEKTIAYLRARLREETLRADNAEAALKEHSMIAKEIKATMQYSMNSISRHADQLIEELKQEKDEAISVMESEKEKNEDLKRQLTELQKENIYAGAGFESSRKVQDMCELINRLQSSNDALKQELEEVDTLLIKALEEKGVDADSFVANMSWVSRRRHARQDSRPLSSRPVNSSAPCVNGAVLPTVDRGNPASTDADGIVPASAFGRGAIRDENSSFDHPWRPPVTAAAVGATAAVAAID